MGKPASAFFQAGADALRLKASQTLMIGDDIRSDVGGAQRAGLTGVLVKTGKFRPQDLDSGVQPDAVLDSIADLPSWWQD
jgi:ribonucleotide monophosphatase NagD (HAD superfamily)